MSDKKEKIFFICQLKADGVEVLKCGGRGPFKKEFLNLEAETQGPGTDDRLLSESLSRIFRKLSYNDNPVIICLPRNSATCRYLRVPAAVDDEIQKIVNLQTSRYLPYPASELVTGYQIIHSDKEGYSDINLVIVHKNAIARFFSIFKEVRPSRFIVALSSYGIYNLFRFIRPQEPGPVMLIDNNAQVELAVIWRDRLVFSRSFKISRLSAGWENSFIEEINKTRDACLKEVPGSESARKIIILGANESAYVLAHAIEDKIDLPVEVLAYHEKIKLPVNVGSKVLNSTDSFAALFGLGLGGIPASLSLLPQDLKEKNRLMSRRKEYLRLGLFIIGIIFIWLMGMLKSLDNKATYLSRLKNELNKISKEAGPLEQMDKKFKALGNYASKKPSSLDILYELHKVMPEQASLVSFAYEEDNHVVLRGQAQELNSINAFVNQLNKSEAFGKFNIILRYTTQKKTQAGEVWDFEVACLKK